MYSTMHFGAWRNSLYRFVNKDLIFRRSLYLSKNFISPLLATSNNNFVTFRFFKNQSQLINKRKMTTARSAGKKIDDVLYPKIEPYKTGMLKVSDLHTIYWECNGNPSGKPVVVLHGGPGGGSQADYRRYFDPAVYHIVQLDQRGCARSTPHAELEDNNTQAIIADIEKLREHLNIGKLHCLAYHLDHFSR